MGFFRNIIEKTVNKVMEVTKAPEKAREPVRETVSDGIKSFFDNIVQKFRKPTELQEKPKKEKKKKEKFRRPDKTGVKDTRLRDPEFVKAGRVKTSKDGTETTLEFDLLISVIDNFTFELALNTICDSIRRHWPELAEQDVIISGYFSGQWRALSPLLPFDQSVQYCQSAGIEIAKYKSGMKMDLLSALSFRFVAPDYGRERGI